MERARDRKRTEEEGKGGEKRKGDYHMMLFC